MAKLVCHNDLIKHLYRKEPFTMQQVILANHELTTSNLVQMLEDHQNLKLRVLHVYPDSTAKHAFYLIRKVKNSIRFVECWLGQEEGSEWSFNLFELPSEVFLFLLNEEQPLAHEALEELDSYMTGSVESYATFNMYKHRESSSVQEVSTFVDGDWWLPK